MNNGLLMRIILWCTAVLCVRSFVPFRITNAVSFLKSSESELAGFLQHKKSGSSKKETYVSNLKGEGRSRNRIFFVLTNKQTTLSWVTDRCLSFHSASDPSEIPLQRSKKFVIGRRHFEYRLGDWPRIRDIKMGSWSKLKLARSSNAAGQFQVHSFSAALVVNWKGSFNKQPRRQRQGKRHLKNDFQIFQTCSR